MSGVNLKEMEEDLRQIKNMIEIMKGISFDALHILKRGEDIAYDVRTVLTKLNIELHALRDTYEISNSKQFRQNLASAEFENT